MPTIKELFTKITTENTEDEVWQEVENAKGEYVYDWEDEFDSMEEAYAEQGRGEAENLTLGNLIKQNGGRLIPADDYSELLDQLAEHYCLSTE